MEQITDRQPVETNGLERLVQAAKSEIDAVMSRHSNVALMFSGGKDSLACLYLFREYWPRLTVMWCNPGDPYPETLEIMAKVRGLVADFREIQGMVTLNTVLHGFPCDMVPVSATEVGRACEKSSDTFVLQSRYQCCSMNFWEPMRQAVVAMGITLKVTGQRAAESLTAPVTSGSIDNDGVEYLLPVEHWSRDQVTAYLRSENVDLPRWYAYGLPSPDCMHCTAYLSENKARRGYLREFYPEVADEYERRLRLIQKAQDWDSLLVKIALGEIASNSEAGEHLDFK